VVIFLHLLNSATLIASIALMYGGVQRMISRTPLRDAVLGLIFGAGASLSMLQPMVMSQGVIVDARSLFLGFAGAFVGPLGAGVALIVAATARLMFGVTQAAMIGVVSMLLATAMGLMWPRLSERLGLRGIKGFLLLGLMVSTSLVTLMFLSLSADAPPKLWLAALLIAYNLAGTLTLGGVIARDHRRDRRERAAQRDADTDSLTGLLNRRSLDSLFKAATHMPSSQGTILFLIDIDRFKSINDRFGHAVGDQVLRSVAQSLVGTMRAGDSILRLGGEEFAVLMVDASEDEARAAGQRILENMRIELLLGDETTISVTSSVGAHYWRPDRTTFARAYEHADAALYQAKKSGRDRIVFSSEFAPPPGVGG
jgi:diguanylate cyclase